LHASLSRWGQDDTDTWEEVSDLKEYPYKIIGGTGKYEGVSGGGTNIYENLTDTLTGGTCKGHSARRHRRT
jgi:hypothetical protein